jgi:dTDP-4-amino-4,6-dideoxygalactose transaminase
VPSNTYIATILAIVQSGHIPVLVEPDIRTYNIDPAKCALAITPKTKAIMVVHLYGKACEMDQLLGLCREHKLALIEDCAQAHGAEYKGKKVGTFGIGAFSFYPTKNLGCLGDGGAVVTSDERIAAKIKTLRNYGSKVKYYNEVVGYNSRLDEVQAGFLSVKLKHLAVITEHKRTLARYYFDNLAKEYILPVEDKDFYDVFHIFNVRHPQRDELRQYLLDHGVKTEIHYPVSPNKQQAMRGILDQIACPISEEIHATTLSLPISYATTLDEVKTVVEHLNAFISGKRA